MVTKRSKVPKSHMNFKSYFKSNVQKLQPSASDKPCSITLIFLSLGFLVCKNMYHNIFFAGLCPNLKESIELCLEQEKQSKAKEREK